MREAGGQEQREKGGEGIQGLGSHWCNESSTEGTALRLPPVSKPAHSGPELEVDVGMWGGGGPAVSH